MKARLIQRFSIFFVLVVVTAAGASPLSLQNAIQPSQLQDELLGAKTWHPFPTVHEHKVWQSLADSVKHLLIKEGEAYLDYSYPALPATLFLDFVRSGNRKRFQVKQHARRQALGALVLAECVEGKGRFLDSIANGIWAICEESYWGVPAHLNMQKAGFGLADVQDPTVDLFVGETSHLLAWTLYLLNYELDKVSPLLRERIIYEIDRRVLKPCLKRNDFWWMGFGKDPFVNNWNPWCNSNWLVSLLIVEKDQEKRLAAIEKILKSLDRFIASYPEDGGCDEGPGYWKRAAGSLFDCLELLYSATGGAIDVYDEPLIRKMGTYIYRAHIAGPYFINFADAPARVNIPAELVFRYGRRINDENMIRFASCFAMQQGKEIYANRSIGRILYALFNRDLFKYDQPQPPWVRDVWMQGNQVMAARSRAGSDQGFYLAAQGGHNAESHNHNDVGNFIVYYNGQPLIIDIGVETYTAKTFSPQRYEIWTMQSAFHNLPTINRFMQMNGKAYRAGNVQWFADDQTARLQMDIASAWSEKAGVETWKRDIRLDRESGIHLTDAYQLSRAEALEFNFMLACKPREVAAGQLQITPLDHKARLCFHYDDKKIKPVIERIELSDPNLMSNWGEELYRLKLVAKRAKKQDRYQFTIKP